MAPPEVGFVSQPTWLLREPRATPMARFLYSVLMSHMRPGWNSWVLKKQTLMEEMFCDVKTLEGAVKILVAIGAVQVELRPGKASRYILAFTEPGVFQTPTHPENRADTHPVFRGDTLTGKRGDPSLVVEVKQALVETNPPMGPPLKRKRTRKYGPQEILRLTEAQFDSHVRRLFGDPPTAPVVVEREGP